ncbi:GNAT family N-acetyltransferase [Microlunatus sp. GCM10028923]|uniref:GNAT family N-acetyltransferase n=1 Tax=Microlunatus sp. GCM10028923 TaxID=3273400 RepID=UPI0036125327
MQAILVTDRLAFTPITRGDIDRLTDLDSDPEVMRFIDRHPTPRKAMAAQVEAIIAEYARTPGFGQWIALSREAQEFLGWFALRRTAEPGHATLGYRLRRVAWGLGLASEGGRALVDYGFRDHDLDRITADTMAVNERSRRVMTAVGMSYLRTYHEEFVDPLPGTDQGEVEYEITRTAWLLRRTPSR